MARPIRCYLCKLGSKSSLGRFFFRLTIYPVQLTVYSAIVIEGLTSDDRDM